MKKLFGMMLSLAALTLVGCSTMPERQPFQVSEVVPGECERVAVDNIAILIDSSGSMRDPEKFPNQKALFQSFVEAMPSGNYTVSVIQFGRDKTWHIYPQQTFNRASLADQAALLDFTGGLTPLGSGLGMAEEELYNVSGRSKVLIFSDGRATDPHTLERNLPMLVQNTNAVLNAVKIGVDSQGESTLQDIVSKTPGGIYTNDLAIDTPQNMRSFVYDLFIEEIEDCGEEPEIIEPDPPQRPVQFQDDVWTLPSNVLFEYDKAVLKPESRPVMNEVAQVLTEHSDIVIRIEGHTCDIGSNAYNQALSERRAQAVYDFLIQSGISPSRLSTVGYGETRPAYPNTSESNRELNRRVEFHIVE